MARKIRRIKPAEPTVYIGPALPGLPQYTLFIGGEMPAHIKAMVEKQPALLGLIVSAKDLQAARNRMKKKGSFEFECAHSLRKEN